MAPKVYISSSWKNRDAVRTLAIELRSYGFGVYDFTDPKSRSAPELPPEKYPEQFDPAKHNYAEYLKSMKEYRAAVFGNQRGIDAPQYVVLLLPCGLDSHADWAYGVGKKKRTLIVGHPGLGVRVPSHLWADGFVSDATQVAKWLTTDYLSKDFPGNGGF